eukprot:scpid32260/ scgid17292/ 
MGVLPYIRRFDWAGPFPIGKLEVDGDPVAAQYGDVVSAWRNRSTATFYSELVGRELRWEEVDAAGDPAGTVRVQPDVDWNDLVNGMGSMGLLEWQAWFVAEFAVNRDATYVVRCLDVNTVWIDDKMINGDVYHREQFWFSIPLESGLHLFRVKLRTKAQLGVFRCEFAIQDGNTMAIHHPHFVPELLARHTLNGLLAVPIFNRNGKKWLDPSTFRISLSVQSKEIPLSVSLPEDLPQLPIAPGQLSTLVVQLSNKAGSEPGTDLNGCPPPKRGQPDTYVQYSIRIATSGVGKTHETRLNIRCRNYTNSFLFTFIDHDGSVQHAAAIRPVGDCPESGCPVMLSMHGTGVTPGNQADSYKHMENGEMQYGLDTVWTLAPTRHGAHNWEGPGALTALTALKALAELVKDNPWIPHKVDVNRVLFAGHSMGGHGCWHLATHFPDLALGVSTAAGWNTKEEYGSSNLFFVHDVSSSFIDPSVKRVLESCISENEVDRHVSNLKGVPVLARVGADDRTVHPYYLRRMRRALEASGVRVNYTELAGKDHWWWDTKTSNDGGVTGDEEVRRFVNEVTAPIKTPVCKAKGEKGCVAATSRYSRGYYLTEKMRARGTFLLTVVNPAFQGSVRGVAVVQQILALRQSTVKITIQPGRGSLRTVNVRRLSFSEPAIAPAQWSGRKVDIDGSDVSALIKSVTADKAVQLCRPTLSDKWGQCKDAENERLASTMGPARRVAERPFLIVVGTSGSSEDTASLHQAALYIANLFFLMSDTLAPVIHDSKLSPETAAKYNLIIVGGPQLNSFAESALSRVPISVGKGGIQLQHCTYKNPQSGALVLTPHGAADGLALVLAGNTVQGVLNVASLATPTIPPMARSPFSNLIPDYLVTGPELDGRGPAGYLCAGFWGNSWNWQPELASCTC